MTPSDRTPNRSNHLRNMKISTPVWCKVILSCIFTASMVMRVSTLQMKGFDCTKTTHKQIITKLHAFDDRMTPDHDSLSKTISFNAYKFKLKWIIHASYRFSARHIAKWNCILKVSKQCAFKMCTTSAGVKISVSVQWVKFHITHANVRQSTHAVLDVFVMGRRK